MTREAIGRALLPFLLITALLLVFMDGLSTRVLVIGLVGGIVVAFLNGTNQLYKSKRESNDSRADQPGPIN